MLFPRAPFAPGWQSQAVVTERELSVPALRSSHFLARALAAALDALGWHVRDRSRRLVLVADDDGALPAPTAADHVVLVGGLRCLDALTEGMRQGGSAAVNADLPFAEVVLGVDTILRAGPTSRSDQERRLQALRARRAEAARFAALTDREAAVLADLVYGRPAAEIAARRPVAVATIRSQVAAILRKLDVGSQAAAIAMAYRSCCDNRVLPTVRFHQNYG